MIRPKGNISHYDLSPYFDKPIPRLPQLISNANKMIAKRNHSTSFFRSSHHLSLDKSNLGIQNNQLSSIKDSSGLLIEDDQSLDVNKNNSDNQQAQKITAEQRDDKEDYSQKGKKSATSKDSKCLKYKPQELSSLSESKSQVWPTELKISQETSQLISPHYMKLDKNSSFDPENINIIKKTKEENLILKSRLKGNLLPSVYSPNRKTDISYQQESKSPPKDKTPTPSNKNMINDLKKNTPLSGIKKIQLQLNSMKKKKESDSEEITELYSIIKQEKSPEKRFQNPKAKALRKLTQNSKNYITFEKSITIVGTQNAYGLSMRIEKELQGIVTDYYHKTRTGKLPNSYIIHTNFSGHSDRFFFGVCDGHGINGHLVSNFVKVNLPKNLEAQYKSAKSKSFENIEEIIRKGFLKIQKQLSESSIDIHFSGTTAVSVLIFGNHLWCANVGDSRAILAKYKDDTWSAFPLSNDHKPNSPQELERILKNGGRVEAYKGFDGEFVGPPRVWLKDENLPGLAMSRSIGDHVASLVGVIADPEITHFELKNEDKFIVIGSDGLYEFLSNEQIIEIIKSHYLANQLELACESLVKKAAESWGHLDDMVDDITCIIISLNVPPKNSSVQIPE